jgi:hypothetical protein
MTAAEPFDPGPKPKLEWLPVDKLSVDHRYQRDLESRRSQALIARIAEHFRWSAFQAILAVKAEGGWLVLDGQHRVEAAKRRGIAEVPAVVVKADSVEEQAAAFVQANRDRVTVNQFALYHAQLAAGEKFAVDIARLCRGARIAVPRYPVGIEHIAPGQTLAVGTIGGLLHNHGYQRARLALNAVADSYRAIAGGLRAPFFLAAMRVIRNGDAARREAIAGAITAYLSRFSPAEIEAKAAALKAAEGLRPKDALERLFRDGAEQELGAAIAAPAVTLPDPPMNATAQSLAEPSAEARFARLVRRGASIKLLAATFHLTEAEAHDKARAVDRGGR